MRFGQLFYFTIIHVKHPDDVSKSYRNMYVNFNIRYSTFYQCEFADLLCKCKYFLMH